MIHESLEMNHCESAMNHCRLSSESLRKFSSESRILTAFQQWISSWVDSDSLWFTWVLNLNLKWIWNSETAMNLLLGPVKNRDSEAFLTRWVESLTTGLTFHHGRFASESAISLGLNSESAMNHCESLENLKQNLQWNTVKNCWLNSETNHSEALRWNVVKKEFYHGET